MLQAGRGTNRAHNGSEDCQDCNCHVDSAGSNWKPHHCVRCRTLRHTLHPSDSVSLRTSSNRLGVSNTQLRIALQSADILSAAQCVVQIDKNVWTRMCQSVSSSVTTRLRGDPQLIEFPHELDCGIRHLQMRLLVDCAVNQTEPGTQKKGAPNMSQKRGSKLQLVANETLRTTRQQHYKMKVHGVRGARALFVGGWHAGHEDDGSLLLSWTTLVCFQLHPPMLRALEASHENLEHASKTVRSHAQPLCKRPKRRRTRDSSNSSSLGGNLGCKFVSGHMGPERTRHWRDWWVCPASCWILS